MIQSLWCVLLASAGTPAAAFASEHFLPVPSGEPDPGSLAEADGRELQAATTTVDSNEFIGSTTGAYEGPGGTYGCAPKDLSDSSFVGSIWKQYCSTLTAGFKSFAMSLDCQHAGFSSVSGPDASAAATFASALASCEEAGGATCNIFDSDASFCPRAQVVYKMHINVQLDAMGFRCNGCAFAALKSTVADLEAGILPVHISTALDVSSCPDDSCPAAGGPDAATTTAEEALATTTEETPAADGRLRRLDLDQAPTRELSAATTTAVDDLAESTTGGIYYDSPPGGGVASAPYACVCGMKGKCPADADVNTCQAAARRRLDEDEGEFLEGRQLVAVGAGGAEVVATSTIDTFEADIENFVAAHNEKSRDYKAVSFMNNALQAHLTANGVNFISSAPGRRLAEDGGYGIVEVTSVYVVDPTTDITGAQEDSMAHLAMVAVMTGIVLHCLLAVVLALICSDRAKKRKLMMAGGAAAGWDDPAPVLEGIEMADPRPGMEGQVVPVVGFGPEVNQRCNAAFLENSFVLPRSQPLHVRARDGEVERVFSNAEAAFLALPFWSRVEEFEQLSAEEARQRASEMLGAEESVHHAVGLQPFEGMKVILEAKFHPDTWMQQALLSTKDAFLVYHSAEERPWSDGGHGEGGNVLGMALMLVRDQLRQGSEQSSSTWTDFIQAHCNIQTGQSLPSRDQRWQQTVRNARAALVGESNVAIALSEANEAKMMRDERPEETVGVSLKVSGVDYHRLAAHSSLKADFENEVRFALAHQVGGSVRPDQVGVELSAGSVLVDAEVSLPRGMSASHVRSMLDHKAVESSILSRIANLYNISLAQIGQIRVVMLKGFPAKAALAEVNPFLVELDLDQNPFLAPLPATPLPATNSVSPSPQTRTPGKPAGVTNSQPFLLPLSPEPSRPSAGPGDGAWRPPEGWRPPSARRRGRGFSPEDTNRGKKIPLTRRGGGVAMKV